MRKKIMLGLISALIVLSFSIPAFASGTVTSYARIYWTDYWVDGATETMSGTAYMSGANNLGNGSDNQL